MVRATRRILSWARAERPISVIAPFEQIAALAVQDAELAGLPVRHVGVVARRRTVEPRGLTLPGSGHHGPHLGVDVPGVAAGQLAKRHGGDFDVNVDAVQEGTGDLPM